MNTHARSTANWLLGCALAASLAACAHDESAAVKPAAPTALPTAETTVTSAEQTVAVGPTVAVAPDLAQTCSVRFGDVTNAPKFDTNASELSAAEFDALTALAECVTTGPLQGRSLLLVGRADPRGTPRHNARLGGERADSVRAFLEHVGVPRDRLRLTTRGDLDAVGTDESGWRVDRRVDVILLGAH